MKVTFGCIIIRNNKILLVREKSEKSKQLEKWNFPSGTAQKNEFVFDKAIQREMKEEVGLKVNVRGLVAVYESITPVDRAYYFVVACTVNSARIEIHDSDIIDAQFFDLEEFYKFDKKEIVHPDMKVCVKKYLNQKYINQLKTVNYS